MKLSFCIPTFNRVKYLQELLSSILNGAPIDIEIIISDNGSTDGTEQFIKNLKKLFPCIRYFRFPTTVEVGQNLLNVVDLATGDYCWLMSDDDILEKSALAHVIKLLCDYPELSGISVNAEGYDKLLLQKKNIRYTHEIDKLTLFKEALNCYKHLGTWFGFWSGLIVKRKLWKNITQTHHHLKYLGYHHLYIVTKIISISPYWLFTPRKCVGYRADNESFSNEYGSLKRFEIDLTSYTNIGTEIFGASCKEIRLVYLRVIKNYLFWQIIAAKLKNHPMSFFLHVLKRSFIAFRTRIVFWTRIVPACLLPSFFWLTLRWCKRKFMREKHG